jgi:hypothetical protein
MALRSIAGSLNQPETQCGMRQRAPLSKPTREVHAQSRARTVGSDSELSICHQSLLRAIVVYPKMSIEALVFHRCIRKTSHSPLFVF